MRRVPLTGRAVDRARAELTFIGNATTLLRLGGCTLLTDPSFLHAGDHVHVGYGLFAAAVRDHEARVRRQVSGARPCDLALYRRMRQILAEEGGVS